MPSYELNRAMHGIHIDKGKAVRFAAGDNSVLDEYDLTEQEREALATRDFPRLWALNAHPMILFHLSAVLNPREWYMQNVVPNIKGVPNIWYDYYRDASGETAE